MMILMMMLGLRDALSHLTSPSQNAMPNSHPVGAQNHQSFPGLGSAIRHCGLFSFLSNRRLPQKARGSRYAQALIDSPSAGSLPHPMPPCPNTCLCNTSAHQNLVLHPSLRLMCTTVTMFGFLQTKKFSR